MKYVILVLVVIFAVYETIMLTKAIIRKVKEKKERKSNEEKSSEEINQKGDNK